MEVGYPKELMNSAGTIANAPGFKIQFRIVNSNASITQSMPTHKILKSLQFVLFAPS